MVNFSTSYRIGTKWRGNAGAIFSMHLREIPQVTGVLLGRGGPCKNTQSINIFTKVCSHYKTSILCFQRMFFPIYTKISSTLSFSQEWSDKNRKAQWLSILELSSEAKGKVWGQSEARAWGVPDLILNWDASTQTSEGFEDEIGDMFVKTHEWNYKQRAA